MLKLIDVKVCIFTISVELHKTAHTHTHSYTIIIACCYIDNMHYAEGLERHSNGYIKLLFIRIHLSQMSQEFTASHTPSENNWRRMICPLYDV